MIRSAQSGVDVFRDENSADAIGGGIGTQNMMGRSDDKHNLNTTILE